MLAASSTRRGAVVEVAFLLSPGASVTSRWSHASMGCTDITGREGVGTSSYRSILTHDIHVVEVIMSVSTTNRGSEETVSAPPSFDLETNVSGLRSPTQGKWGESGNQHQRCGDVPGGVHRGRQRYLIVLRRCRFYAELGVGRQAPRDTLRPSTVPQTITRFL